VRHIRLRRWALLAGLAGVLLATGAFRLFHVDWDSGQHLHPDERFIVMVDTALQWPSTFAQYFDSARSPLNPYNRNFGNFVYGTLPVFLLKGVGSALDKDNYD